MRRPALPTLCLIIFAVQCVGVAAVADNSSAPPGLVDPFGYCNRVGTIDEPFGGGSPVPEVLMQYVRAAIGLSADAPLTPHSYYWRCMDRAVFICAIGANIPCNTKADRAERNAGADNYCHENQNAESVPAYATGHNGIYEWSCRGGKPVRWKLFAKLDRRGYRAEFWHRVMPLSHAPNGDDKE